MKRIFAIALLVATCASAQVSGPGGGHIPPPQHHAPTLCPAEQEFWHPADDVILPVGANLTVMFHGNRQPAAADLVAGFEALNPSIKVAYSTLPPVYTVLKLDNIPAPGMYKELGGLNLDAFSKPDLVMLPVAAYDRVARHLEFPRAWSDITGLMLVKRHGDARIQSLKDMDNTSVKLVFAGMQDLHHATYAIYRSVLSEKQLDDMLARPTTSFSSIVHHRSTAARILAQCADAGVQFQQAKFYLEKMYPGKFEFIDLPVTLADRIQESSFAAVVKGTQHRDAAEKFKAYLTSAPGQTILRKYGLESKL